MGLIDGVTKKIFRGGAAQNEKGRMRRLALCQRDK